MSEEGGRVSGTSPIIDRQIEARTHHVGAASSVTRGRGDGELVMLFFCVRVEKKKSRPVFFILLKKKKNMADIVHLVVSSDEEEGDDDVGVAAPALPPLATARRG